MVSEKIIVCEQSNWREVFGIGESQGLEIAQLVLQNSVDSIQIHKQPIPEYPQELKVPDVLAVVKGKGRGVLRCGKEETG